MKRGVNLHPKTSQIRSFSDRIIIHSNPTLLIPPPSLHPLPSSLSFIGRITVASDCSYRREIKFVLHIQFIEFVHHPGIVTRPSARSDTVMGAWPLTVVYPIADGKKMLLIQPTRDGDNGFFPQLVTGRSVCPTCAQAIGSLDYVLFFKKKGATTLQNCSRKISGVYWS